MYLLCPCLKTTDLQLRVKANTRDCIYWGLCTSLPLIGSELLALSSIPHLVSGLAFGYDLGLLLHLPFGLW